jgi:hypothetical protein
MADIDRQFLAGEVISVDEALALFDAQRFIELSACYVELLGPSDPPDGPLTKLPAENVANYLARGFRERRPHE